MQEAQITYGSGSANTVEHIPVGGFPAVLAANLLGHHAQQLVGRLDRGVDKPRHLSARHASYKVTCVYLFIAQ